MSKIIGENKRMQRSSKYFESKYDFYEMLTENTDKEMLENILKCLGVIHSTTIKYYLCSDLELITYFGKAIIVTEEKEEQWSRSRCTIKIKSRDATKLRDAAVTLNYNNIVKLCNRWMGLDDNVGMTTYEKKPVSDLHKWCNKNKLDFLIPILDKNEFETIDDIQNITKDDLQRMGIDKLGHQNRVLSAIITLK